MHANQELPKILFSLKINMESASMEDANRANIIFYKQNIFFFSFKKRQRREKRDICAHNHAKPEPNITKFKTNLQ
jgi:hypothetical protein